MSKFRFQTGDEIPMDPAAGTMFMNARQMVEAFIQMEYDSELYLQAQDRGDLTVKEVDSQGDIIISEYMADPYLLRTLDGYLRIIHPYIVPLFKIKEDGRMISYQAISIAGNYLRTDIMLQEIGRIERGKVK